MFLIKKETEFLLESSTFFFIFSLPVFKLNMSNDTESTPTALYDDNFVLMECASVQ